MCLTMDRIVKIAIFAGLINCLTASVLAYNSSSSTHFTGLLNDVLQTNRQHDLAISKNCNQELLSIQNGLDQRDVWAIKCKCFNRIEDNLIYFS